MLDKTKRYLVVGLGLLGGKYALELHESRFPCGRHQPQREGICSTR